MRKKERKENLANVKYYHSIVLTKISLPYAAFLQSLEAISTNKDNFAPM